MILIKNLNFIVIPQGPGLEIEYAGRSTQFWLQKRRQRIRMMSLWNYILSPTYHQFGCDEIIRRPVCCDFSQHCVFKCCVGLDYTKQGWQCWHSCIVGRLWKTLIQMQKCTAQRVGFYSRTSLTINRKFILHTSRKHSQFRDEISKLSWEIGLKEFYDNDFLASAECEDILKRTRKVQTGQVQKKSEDIN